MMYIMVEITTKQGSQINLRTKYENIHEARREFALKLQNDVVISIMDRELVTLIRPSNVEYVNIWEDSL